MMDNNLIYMKKKKAKPKKGENLPKSAKVLVPIGKGLYQSRRVPTDVVWNAAATLCSGARDFLNPAV
ncbi:MAG TPA: hypothetical protein VFF31_30320, partial [Blastocatellia bacterium]|nr:hypothetical protein [Blastocatellia bacterium]